MFSAWILDAYPVPEGMCLWLIDTNGRARPVWDPWAPSFYLKASPADRPSVRRVLESFNSPFTLNMVERKEFFTREFTSVLQARLSNPLLYTAVVNQLLTISGLQLFNADLNLAQYYFYERGLFPLARSRFEIREDGCLLSHELEDSPWNIDTVLPPLRYAHLGLDSRVDPNHRKKGTYVLTLGPRLEEGTSYVLEGTEEDLIRSVNHRMETWDPDILLTDWGDSYLMPRLELFSEKTGCPLRLSRDPRRYLSKGEARSYFSYGKIIYKAGARTLYGRLHIDTKNSFLFGHDGLDGLFEIARVAKIPLQRAARVTIGTSLSSLQQDWAIQNNVLIPLDKGQTEDFRPAEDLIASDRGGLVYEPDIGWHEDVIEYDFSSMYPEIMIRNNVTPEAINCACCSDNKVPEISHHICRRFRGMIPAVLGPIVEKRRRLKALIKQNHPLKDVYKLRSDAFKWTLVTCFGYLGFRNARFGRIEAHECVNAFSRETLLRAKDVAEAEGFHFLHAIVDSLWLKKPGASDAEAERVRKRIEEATGLPLVLEGRYRWIRFCASRENARVGVPTRYFGAMTTGDLKVRGIELRRHDTPLFLKSLQSQLLSVMATAPDLRTLFRKRRELESIVEGMRDRLKSGQVTPLDLAISVHLRRNPEDYLHDTLSAIAAKTLALSGVKLSPGETIQYVVGNEHDAIKDWRVTPLALIQDTFEYDRVYYERLFTRAADTVLFFPVEPEIPGAILKKKKAQLLLPGLW